MATNRSYEEQVKQETGSLVEQIVKELSTQKGIDIHFEDEEDEPWAVVKVHDYDKDTEKALCLLTEGRWVLHFGYYDEDDDFIELQQPLAQSEVALIPGALQKAMLKVLASEEGIRVPADFLSK